jgi:DNA polymerase III sliding clamp (beta) subunit (PCNA family)
VRRTKIIATLGPASASEAVLQDLIEAGVDIFRLNFSHGTHDTHAEVSARVRRVAERASAMVANDKSGAVRFHVESGLLRITSENPDVGEGSEELDVDFAGESTEIGFNVRYLMDALSGLTEDEVALELGGALDPGVVKPVGPTDFIGVIMPMRI